MHEPKVIIIFNKQTNEQQQNKEIIIKKRRGRKKGKGVEGGDGRGLGGECKGVKEANDMRSKVISFFYSNIQINIYYNYFLIWIA